MVVEGEQHTSLGLGYLFGCLQERIRRRTDVGLVGTAPPATKSLNQVFGRPASAAAVAAPMR